MVIFMDLLLNPDGELWSLQVIILGAPIRRSAGSPRFFGGREKDPPLLAGETRPGESLFFPEQTAFLLTPIFKVLISVLRNPRVHRCKKLNART